MKRNQLFSMASAVAVLALMLSACATPTPNVAPTTAATQGSAATQVPVSTKAPEATTAPQNTAAPEPTAEAPAGAITLPVIDPASVEGDIITAGSSTVFPVTERMAELFGQEGYNGNITVDSIATGAGFERFCVAGETDISNASRAIKGSEADSCRGIGREPLEFRVGTDALAVVVNPESPLATRGLSLAELTQIFSGTVTTWDQLDASLPKETIQIYSPGTDSGTFDYFVEVVLGKVKEGLLAVAGAQFSEDDNVLAQGVEGSPYAIGYFGYAYYAEAGSKLKAVPINGVEPGQATVDDGTYPLSRPLFIYSTAQIMHDKPQVAAFIGFYLSQLEANIVDVGYFPAPAKDLYASWGAFYAGATSN